MPSSPIPALFNHALTLHRAGRLDEAEAAYRQIMRADPRDFPSRCMLGRLRLEQGRTEEAAKLLEAAVGIDDRAVQGVAYYGVALLRLGKYAPAAAMFEKAVAAAPNDAMLWRNRGDALLGLEQFADAHACYDKAIALEPRPSEALARRAETRLAMARPAEALADSEAALKLEPDLDMALFTRAAALDALERNNEAIEAYSALLARAPGDAGALFGRASLLIKEGRFAEALADCDAMARNEEVLTLRGIALNGLRRFDEAIASYDDAIAINPNVARVFFNRGVVLTSIGRAEEAVESYSRAIALDPDYIGALNNRSGDLIALRRFTEAKDGLERVLSLAPNHIYAFGGLAHCLSLACDWSRREDMIAGLKGHVLGAKSEIPPGTLLGYLDDPALQLACARHYAALNFPKTAAYDGPAYAHDKIKLAYLSADFHDHATARLAVEMFERHDRTRFEIIGISFGPDDDSPLQRRTAAAFDQFHDVRLKNDAEVAALLRALEIDIAIDLKGFTADARAGIFARRPAPIQVSYLGFPGTLGADFYDYVLADEITAPPALQPFFSENIVRLSGCYQPNDSKRALPTEKLSRREAGLPETGFVFCCFNNNFKINQPFFDVWMRLLGAIDGAVLWLIDDNADAAANLRKQAAARGIDPSRLIFAPRVTYEAHLARHQHADLFLDTLPYGAHTTASDALWMGVPVLTCLGAAFAGRVGASLCHAVGLDELVMEDLAQYEQTALALARDPARLAAIKARLIADRTRHRLFDAERHTRSVEAAFTEMVARLQRGQPPAPFSV